MVAPASRGAQPRAGALRPLTPCALPARRAGARAAHGSAAGLGQRGLPARAVVVRVAGGDPVQLGAQADAQRAAAALAVDQVGLGEGALLGAQGADLRDLLGGEVQGVGDVGDVVGALAQEQLDRRVVQERAAVVAGEVGALLADRDQPQADVAGAAGLAVDPRPGRRAAHQLGELLEHEHRRALHRAFGPAGGLVGGVAALDAAGDELEDGEEHAA